MSVVEISQYYFELRVETNDINLAGTHAVNLVVGFDRADVSVVLTETFNVVLVHPCKETLVYSEQTIGPLEYYFGDPDLLWTFTDFENTVA